MPPKKTRKSVADAAERRRERDRQRGKTDRERKKEFKDNCKAQVGRLLDVTDTTVSWAESPVDANGAFQPENNCPHFTPRLGVAMMKEKEEELGRMLFMAEECRKMMLIVCEDQDLEKVEEACFPQVETPIPDVTGLSTDPARLPTLFKRHHTGGFKNLTKVEEWRIERRDVSEEETEDRLTQLRGTMNYALGRANQYRLVVNACHHPFVAAGDKYPVEIVRMGNTSGGVDNDEEEADKEWTTGIMYKLRNHTLAVFPRRGRIHMGRPAPGPAPGAP